jgi:23S rRNA (adenine2503-C2)-methyltransferase
MIELMAEQGNDELAKVYVVKMRDSDEHLVEFVESVQPPFPREEKWVLIVSTMFGCPIGCSMCDASNDFKGKLTANEIMDEIDHMVLQRYPDRRVPVPKLKIQFARMGDPALNPNVLEVLEKLPGHYKAPGIMPSISTIAPAGTDAFFQKLIRVKNKHYRNGRFQFQFSVHTTDDGMRRKLIPANTWPLERMADYGEAFFSKGDRKITLNFAVAKGYPIDTEKMRALFDTDKFLIKLTPINPTKSAEQSGLVSQIDAHDPDTAKELVADFQSKGFETILSIGEVEENKIGSNCGMFVSQVRDGVL